MPDGKTARSLNFGALDRDDWRTMRIKVDDTQSAWSGNYESAEAALAEVQKDFD